MTDELVTDGTRPVGRIVSKAAGSFEVFDAGGSYLFKADSLTGARAALRRHDVDRQALARLEDDGGVPA